MSESLITVNCSIKIGRSVDRVRTQFFDIDHVVRDRLHADIAYRWLPPKEPGERRLQREARLLAQAQTDEVLLEEDADGSMILRFVEGPNKGSLYRSSFFPIDDGTGTRVEVTAALVAGPVRLAIGPLFKLAVRKSIEKSLAEHKRDIEGSYEPGRARGNLDVALSTTLADVIRRARECSRDADRIALVAPLLEAACLTAMADNDVDDAERDAIRSVIRAIGVAALDDDAIEAVVASSIDRTRTEGLEKRCDELGARLKKLKLAESGLAVSALVAHISHGIDQSELDVLQRLGRAAGIDDDAMTTTLEQVERMLMALPSKPPPPMRG